MQCFKHNKQASPKKMLIRSKQFCCNFFFLMSKVILIEINNGTHVYSIDTFDVLVHCGTLGRSGQRLLCHHQALVHWYTGTKGCCVTSKQGVGGE